MRHYEPGRPLVFNHIPKSAGNSLRVALVEALDPSNIVRRVDLSLLGGYDDFEAVRPEIRGSFIFGPEEIDEAADFVTGHVAPGTTMRRFPEADHITMLRNPRLRVVSQWMHSRALSDFDLRRWGRGAAAFRTGRLPFQEYLRHERIAPSVDNTVTRFLCFPHAALERTSFIDERLDAELLDCAAERLGQFSHVDVVENSSFMQGISDWLGWQLTIGRLNERTTMPKRFRPNLEEEFDSKTLDLLDHRTRLDRELWRRIAARTFEDPDDVLRNSWEKSVNRYVRALHEPADSRPIKHTLDAIYGIPNRVNRIRLRALK